MKKISYSKCKIGINYNEENISSRSITMKKINHPFLEKLGKPRNSQKLSLSIGVSYRFILKSVKCLNRIF